MHIVVGVLGGVLVLLMLMEIFFAFLLPRRVKRDPRIVRLVYSSLWRPMRALAARLPNQAGDTLLGIFGPFSLLFDLGLWLLGLMLGYAMLQWAAGSHLATGHPVDFGQDLYFSAATLVSASADGLNAHGAFERAMELVEAATGFAVLAIVIGYLPSLFQAFSRRETTVSMLDARAGSPPSAGRLIARTTELGGWPRLNDYLGEWETWTAELMETHLSYPVLAFFRSQHLHQNWLSALCTVLDSCAFSVAAAPQGTVVEARLTYAIGRHAVVDLSYTFHVQPLPPSPDRLPRAELDQLLDTLSDADVELGADRDIIEERLSRIRESYEPYINALANRLALDLPPWSAPEEPTSNWMTTEWH